MGRGARHLGELAGSKLGIECECGLKRRYDVDAMLDRLGFDIDIPSLRLMLSAAEGCKRADLMGRSLCTVRYDDATVAELKRLA